MDTETFNHNLEARINQIRTVLVKKAAEYATEDRLHNFKVAAELQGVTPRQALAGMMAKHTVSVYDLCRAEDLAKPAVWDEKLGDHLNYLFLLSAIVEEEENDKPNSIATFDFRKTVPAKTQEFDLDFNKIAPPPNRDPFLGPVGPRGPQSSPRPGIRSPYLDGASLNLPEMKLFRETSYIDKDHMQEDVEVETRILINDGWDVHVKTDLGETRLYPQLRPQGMKPRLPFIFEKTGSFNLMRRNNETYDEFLARVDRWVFSVPISTVGKTVVGDEASITWTV